MPSPASRNVWLWCPSEVPGVRGADVVRFDDREKLDEIALELDQAIISAEGVVGPGRRGEAEPLVEPPVGVQIVDAEHQVVDAPVHCLAPFCCRALPPAPASSCQEYNDILSSEDRGILTPSQFF